MAISNEMIREIKRRYRKGQSKLSISRELGISRGTVNKYATDKNEQLYNVQKNEQKVHHRRGRPLKWNTPEELQLKIDEYFDSCWDFKRDMFGGRIEDKIPVGVTDNGKTKWKKNGYVMKQVKPYTVSGLAVYLGTSRETLMNYQKRDEYFDAIKSAKDRVYAYVEESLFYGKPTGAIFSLKNNYGWKDKYQQDSKIVIENNIQEILELTNNAKDVNIDPKEEIEEFKAEMVQ